MRKTVLFIILSLMISLTGNSQGILKPIPDNYFNTAQALGKSSELILRLNTGVMGVSYGKNKVTGKFEPIPFSALAFGIGLLHYKEVNEIPFNDFGINLLLLQNTKSAGMGIGIYGTYNTGLADDLGILNLGTHYDFTLKQVLLDTGLTFHF